jgi:hypothetical protein
VYLTDFMVYTSVVQNTLGGSSLTGINVSGNTNISREFKIA